MKKIFILFLSLSLLTACDKDDDDTNVDGKDPIVGTWILVEASTPINTQFCSDEESTITFNENKTGSATFFLTANDCDASDSEGTWENLDDSKYRITVPVLGNLEGTANFTSATRFTFTTTIVGIPGVLTFEKQ